MTKYAETMRSKKEWLLVLSKYTEIEQLHADAKRKHPYTDALHDVTENVQSSKKRVSDKIADITAQLADAPENLAALADDKRCLKEDTFGLTKQLAQANNLLACKDAHIASLKAQVCTKTGSNGGTHSRNATSSTQVNRYSAAPDGKGKCDYQKKIARLNSKMAKADCAQEHSACQLEKMEKCLELKEREIMMLIGKLADQPFRNMLDTPMKSPADSPVCALSLKQHLQYMTMADALVCNKPSCGHTTPRMCAEGYPTDESSDVSASCSNHKSNVKSVCFALD
ncbi:hypothetical protein GGF37_002505 [Kickxella alabastrina]|nr:hypothetical protein GGF37_002505 [Kickxella alabastrina]